LRASAHAIAARERVTNAAHAALASDPVLRRIKRHGCVNAALTRSVCGAVVAMTARHARHAGAVD
jgi:hypothetical protein